MFPADDNPIAFARPMSEEEIAARMNQELGLVPADPSGEVEAQLAAIAEKCQKNVAYLDALDQRFRQAERLLTELVDGPHPEHSAEQVAEMAARLAQLTSIKLP